MSIVVVPPRIIGICGKPGSGKDTVAGMLREILGYEYASFGDAIRTELSAILVHGAWIPHELVADPYHEELACLLLECKGMDPWQKPTPFKLRVCMQKYATEFRRRQDRYYWAKRTDLSGSPKVVPGTREPEQLEAIHENHGIAIWVHRTYREYAPDHEVENMIGPEDCEKVLWNDYTLGELREQVIDAMRSLQ